MRALFLASVILLGVVGTAGAITEEPICTSDPNVILCDNFNDRSLGDINTFYNPNTNFQTNLGGKSTAWGNNNVSDNTGQLIVTTGTTLPDGTTASCLDGNCFAQFYAATPRPGVGDGGGFVGSQVYPQVQEFYYRIWFKYPSNWVESPNGSKVIYGENGNTGVPRQEIGSDTVPNAPSLAEAWPWVERGYVNNLEQRIRPNMNLSASGRRLGQWQCLEYHMKHETTSPSAPGVGGSNDGIWQAWVNDPAGGADIQVAQYTGIYFNLTTDAGFVAGQYYTDWLMSSFWNCQNNDCTLAINAHPNMTRLIDKVVVSKARIGCGFVAQPTPPGTPANLAVN